MHGGKLMEMGKLTTLNCDGTKTEYPFSLLIEFKSAEDCKRALIDGHCRFAFGDYPEDATPDYALGVQVADGGLTQIKNGIFLAKS